MSEGWRSLSEEQRRDFIAQHSDMQGCGLQSRMQETIMECTRETSKTLFKGTGHFIDEEDLEKKFGEKPSQLEAIKTRARSMWDAVRQVRLYEVTEFEAQTVDEEEKAHERKRKLEIVTNAAPKAKAKSRASASSVGEACPPLRAPAKKKLSKHASGLASVRVQLDDLAEKAAPLSARIPEYIRAAATDQIAQLRALHSELEAAVSTGQGDEEDLSKRAGERLQEAQDVTRRLSYQVREAQTFAS